MKRINLDLVRVTEAAAIAASQWIGSGDKLSADKAATEAMRERLNRVNFTGRIVIGEGKKDKSAGLFAGERVGNPSPGSPVLDIAVDPIEGTRPTVTSGPEALSVLAVAEQGALFETGEFYMSKLAYGPAIASRVKLNLKDPISVTIEKVGKAISKQASKIKVCILDRPRHEKMIEELRGLGVRIQLIQDCDVSGAIATCMPESGIDLLFGIGGAPEGVITACAIKCLRGGFEAQVIDEKTLQVADPKVYGIEDLAGGQCAFTATGITNGSLLSGVRYTNRRAITHSLFMRSESGTVRWITAHHEY